MKKFAFVAVFALAACGEAASEEPMVEEEVAVEEPAAEVGLAADGLPATGIYEITLPNGDMWTETLNADGTFTAVGPDGEEGSGTWRQESPERFCSTEEGAEEEVCYSESISEDGVWSSTREGSEETSTIVRVG